MKKSITSKIIAFAAAAAMIMSMGAAAFGSFIYRGKYCNI